MPLNTATLTVAQLQARLKRQFGDESGVQITDDDIISWINDGMRELNRKNNIFKTIAITQSVSGQAAYDFPGFNIVSVEQVYYDSNPVEYRSYNNVQELILNSADTQNLTGSSFVWYEFAGSLYLYPTPSTDGLDIKLLCVTEPTPVSSSTDTITIPNDYYEALYQYCVAQAYETDDDMQAAMQKTQQMNATLSELDARTKSHDEQFYPMISVDMEDAF